MTRRSFSLFSLVSGSLLSDRVAAAEYSERIRIYKLPGSQAFPESIAFDSETGDFYTGSLTDGSIVRGNVSRNEAHAFLSAGSDGRTSVAGIKIDRAGRLFAAGGTNKNLFIYNAFSKALLKEFSVNATASTVNDIAILRSGDAFVTDSTNPILYRVHETDHGEFQFEYWLNLDGTAVVYQEGLNLNGITLTKDERYMIVGQTNIGKLFRIEIATKDVVEIDLPAGPLLHCDGILLRGQRLYVAQNAFNQLAIVDLNSDFLAAEKVHIRTDASFAFPTAITYDRGSLLITNAQLDQIGPGLQPSLPFTVSRIDL